MSNIKPARVARIYALGAFRPAILSEPGRKLTRAVINTGVGVKAIALSNRDADKSSDVMLKGAPYPVARAQKHLRRAARRGPVSKTVRALLKGGAA